MRSEQGGGATPEEMAMTGLGYGNGTMLPPKRWGEGVAGEGQETDWRGGREVPQEDTPARPSTWLCLSPAGGWRLATSQFQPPHLVKDHLTTPIPSFPVLPAPSKHRCPHFPSINFSRQKSAPSSQALSPRSNIQEAGTQRDSASHPAEASLGVRVPPRATGRGRGETGPSWGRRVRYAPGGLTDAREAAPEPGGGWGRQNQVLCFDVASVLLSLDCKKLLWWPAHPGWGCTRTWRSPGCQGPAAQLGSRTNPGWPGAWQAPSG